MVKPAGARGGGNFPPVPQNPPSRHDPGRIDPGGRKKSVSCPPKLLGRALGGFQKKVFAKPFQKSDKGEKPPFGLNLCEGAAPNPFADKKSQAHIAGAAGQTRPWKKTTPILAPSDCRKFPRALFWRGAQTSRVFGPFSQILRPWGRRPPWRLFGPSEERWRKSVAGPECDSALPGQKLFFFCEKKPFSGQTAWGAEIRPTTRPHGVPLQRKYSEGSPFFVFFLFLPDGRKGLIGEI